MVEVVVYVPLIATFRQTYLEENLVAAQIAGLSLEEAPGNNVSPELEQELLETAGVISVVMRREDRSLMLGFDRMPDGVNAVYDLQQPALGMLIADAFATLNAKGERIIRVVGSPALSGTRYVEITLDEMDLYQSLKAYSNNILIISLVVSIFTGVLVYLSLHWLLVRPMRRVKESIVTFRRNPEGKNKARIDCKRRDEIGVVERELARMQQELRSNLQQKTKLAELGEAVSKINHDLRNILATAQLATGALERVEHPGVQKASTRLVNAVSRAISLCERTLRHGSVEDPEPEKEDIPLFGLVMDVIDSLGIPDEKHFTFQANIDEDLQIYADPQQLHRVLLNLIRNARDVQGEDGNIAVSAMADDTGTVHMEIADKGPGIPDSVRPNLFKPFMTSNRAGGTGLGLAIARDIVLAHGGQIGLKSSDETGTVFAICIPGRDM
ncbi:ATPase [Kordiimonas sediminis]|uniref:histidine kinase n=2 Tax=Kordiimonas sediminis TaxID=1735581 RepID=A0A919AM34_9PROT|nr:ATPase [Kordiimonas sediminis]